MKVTVVTISFNQVQFLERALQSVLRQDYPDIEYIVVDPGSTDGSRDIIERYRPLLAGVIYDPDNGPADGLNKGFARATGEICGYLNSDDMLLPGAIGQIVEAFRHHQTADVIYGHGYIVDKEDQVIRHFRSDPFTLHRFLRGNAIIMQQSAYWRARVFGATGGFNVENRTCWDGEFWVDVALHGGVLRRVRQNWSAFRLQEDAISFRIRRELSTGSGRLKSAFEADVGRVKAKISSRSTFPGGWVGAVLSRLERWATDPVSFLIRVFDTLPFKNQLPRFK